ncbi:DNA-formamidopyrimidine glycosylase [soil metagenome]
MPELPEVETVRRGLHGLIIGKVVKSETHDTPKGFPNSKGDVSAFLVNAKVTDVRRRAKVLLIDLSTGYTLVIHLKMTGQMVYRGEQVFGAGHPNDSLIGKLPDKSTRVNLSFKDGGNLYFNDQRKFGWMRLMPTHFINEALTGSVLEANARRRRAAEQNVQDGTVREQRSSNAAVDQDTESVIDFMRKVGPEPLEDTFTPEIFIERIRKRAGTTIKATLLDQTVLAGIGNIYADESLWGAKIHPATRVRDVADAKLKSLYTEIRFVLNLAIEKGGSTDRNYVNAEGKRGSYIDFARVFRREGKDCPRHPGTAIIKTRVAGRGTHTCPKCQKLAI